MTTSAEWLSNSKLPSYDIEQLERASTRAAPGAPPHVDIISVK